MIAVPGERPRTSPDIESTVATSGLCDVNRTDDAALPFGARMANGAPGDVGVLERRTTSADRMVIVSPTSMAGTVANPTSRTGAPRMSAQDDSASAPRATSRRRVVALRMGVAV